VAGPLAVHLRRNGLLLPGPRHASPFPHSYADGEIWADDVAAITDQLTARARAAPRTCRGLGDRRPRAGTRRPARSRSVSTGRCSSPGPYGGFIACDYVRPHGQDQIAAIDLVVASIASPAACLPNAERGGLRGSRRLGLRLRLEREVHPDRHASEVSHSGSWAKRRARSGSTSGLRTLEVRNRRAAGDVTPTEPGRSAVAKGRRSRQTCRD
jgi:hypothetical protein